MTALRTLRYNAHAVITTDLVDSEEFTKRIDGNGRARWWQGNKHWRHVPAVALAHSVTFARTPSRCLPPRYTPVPTRRAHLTSDVISLPTPADDLRDINLPPHQVSISLAPRHGTRQSAATAPSQARTPRGSTRSMTVASRGIRRGRWRTRWGVGAHRRHMSELSLTAIARNSYSHRFQCHRARDNHQTSLPSATPVTRPTPPREPPSP